MDFFDLVRSFDLLILDTLHDLLSCNVLDVFFSLITRLGDAGIFWLGTGVVLLFFRKTRRCGICMLLAVALGFLVGNLIIKPSVARIRPYDINGMIKLVISKQSDYSFPSGHTMASFGAAISIFYHFRKAGIAALITASLIAFSRMYLYVHYPTDIIFGIIISLLASFAALALTNYAYNKYQTRFSERLNASA